VSDFFDLFRIKRLTSQNISEYKAFRLSGVPYLAHGQLFAIGQVLNVICIKKLFLTLKIKSYQTKNYGKTNKYQGAGRCCG
jgi:hypothetical protein